MGILDGHFLSIAQKYRTLRTTDSEPIKYIRQVLQPLPVIRAADFGCGAGRYDFKLLQHLGDRLYLYCIDSSKAMLAELDSYLRKHNFHNFTTLHCSVEDCRLAPETFDAIFTFNAIHLFDALHFLYQSHRLLRPEGYLFVYTRFRSQNATSIWGRYFPDFHRKEQRLFELDELKSLFCRIRGLEIEEIKFFRYKRVASIRMLLEQARHHHYSTFKFYSADEFKRALERFEQNLIANFRDPERVHWVDQNVLLVARKRFALN